MRAGKPEVIAIASGKGGTGKTLIGASLGYALTFSGHRVLMVDTDTATHGLSLFLLGPKGAAHISQFAGENTWTGALRSGTPPVPHTIRRDLGGETDHGVSYKAVVSAQGVYGDEPFIESAFHPEREGLRKVLRSFLAGLRSRGEYDYVLIDTRGGFSFESTDVCALADSFIVVTEADLTSLYQDRNLVRLIDKAAGELGTRPLLRSILVNRATDGKEELFRLALEREFPPVKFDQTHAIPLDVEALKSYRVQQMPYVTAPGSHFSFATLEAFRDILSLVTAEWSDDHAERWNQLASRISKAIEEKNRKFEQERAEDEQLRKDTEGLRSTAASQVDKIAALERELQRAEELHRREIERIERFQIEGPSSRSGLKTWLAWMLAVVATVVAVFSGYRINQQQYLLEEAQIRLKESQVAQRQDDLLVKVFDGDLPKPLRVRYLRQAVEAGQRSFDEVTLPKVDLSGIQAPNISFRFADLAGTSLRGANLRGADLSQADLTAANLRDAVLADATLDGARLVDATLIGADLGGASLEGALLTPVQLATLDLTIEQRLQVREYNSAGQ